jgi:4-aminobutyrate aminotransferase/(S)-3-amino-2-methylpropionate transaminase
VDTEQQYAQYLLPVVAKGVEPIVVVRAQGRTVTDANGRDYLDCFSGISVVNAGHGHPRILAAARAQMEQLVHCCSYVYQVPVVGQLAEKLASVAPGTLRKSFLCNSGRKPTRRAYGWPNKRLDGAKSWLSRSASTVAHWPRCR